MANYCNFKSHIVFEEYPLMNNPIIVKVSAVPKGDGTDIKKQLTILVMMKAKKLSNLC